MSISLSLDTLPEVPPKVEIPDYARDALRAGIVHFGVGNFHRAHMQVYLDRLFNAGRDRDWAIVGAGVTPYDEKMRAALMGQDLLTTVVEQSAGASVAHVTGVMTDFLPPMDAGAIIGKLSEPAIRIVSLTVTEGGYFIDPATGRFDPEHPAIRADAETPEAPKTVFGLILAGLRARKDAGLPPLTVLSCDNVPHNGGGGAQRGRRARGGAGSGVGRLGARRGGVSQLHGGPDRGGDRRARDADLPRGFRGGGRLAGCSARISSSGCWRTSSRRGVPALEEAGVTFVGDVTPYETMKIRILNGGHAIIAYASGLMDIEFVHEGMADPAVRAFLQKVEREEIIPIVPPVPDVDLAAYFARVEERCENPKIGDTIRRLCLDGSNRQPKFIIPSIADRLERGEGIAGLALESALWCRYCYGTTDSGAEITPNDPNWDRLQAQAKKAKDDPAAWLAMRDIYGEVAESEVFQRAFGDALRALWTDGAETVLRRYVNGPA